MGQFIYTQQATRSPGVCMACGNVNGPFVDLSIPFIKVPTAIGVLDAESGVYLCVGSEINPGCAVGIGRLTGLMVDTVKLAEAHGVIGELNEEVAELRKQLSAKASVKVEDLLRLGVIQAPEMTGVL